jgi:trans-2,3-dihydro-3-hydroxyanthranilate isomerase
MTRRFQTLDVFTETALAGNPLAVVVDAEGLDDARMQAIAAEFNLSETVFVFEPRDAVNSARVRIFTPKRELPFAGHPTVGAAALIAHRRASDLLAAQDLRIVLEEPIGDVVCVARRRQGQALAAYFELPKLPERLENKPPSTVQIAASLGLELQDIGFDGHEPSVFSAGAPFLFVPVRSLDAIGRAAPGIMPWATKDGPATFVYTREIEREGSAYHARCSPALGGYTRIPRPEAPSRRSPASSKRSTARETASLC